MKKITIAIDGFSSSGKSSMARQLARNIGYAYIDSGAMYRAVTLYVLRNAMLNADGSVDVARLVSALPQVHLSFVVDAETGTSHVALNGEDVEGYIRSMEVSDTVSKVAAIPQVRHALVQQQQRLGAEKGIVMDGRDIGTTVFPDAEMKIYVNASSRTRAERRYKELTEKGVEVAFDDVLRNVEERDHLDMTRAESPLRKADDAIELDNSTMTIAEQNAKLLEIYNTIANA